MAATTTYCTACGASVVEGRRFCSACGADVAGAGTAAAPAAAQPAAAPSWQGAAATVSRTAQYASLATSLPWQTIGAGQAPEPSAILTAAAPIIAQMRPKSNLRWPAIGIFVTVIVDVVTTLLLGGPVSLPALALRTGTGVVTSALGGIVGKDSGTLRKLTGAMSIIYGVVQLVTLGTAAWAALSTPVQLLTLLPSIVVVLSSLALSAMTAIGALRK